MSMSEIRSVPDLPEQVIGEILSKLPVRSLLRLRSISKSWHSLVSTPHFRKSQLSYAIKTNSNNLILTSNKYFSIFSTDFENFTRTISLNLTFPHKDEFYVVGSCNGFICLSDYATFVSLWNPSIREYIMLPYDPINPISNKGRRLTVLGFGYSSVTDEYKVLKLTHSDYNFESYEVKVCTVGSNSWQRLKVEHLLCFRNPSDTFVHFKGVLYWLNNDSNMTQNEVTSVASFDIGRLAFKTFPCPGAMKFSRQDTLTLGVLKGCLSFTHQMRSYNGFFELWLMMDCEWKKSFKFRLFAILDWVLEPIAFQRNGDLVLKCGSNDVIIYDRTKDTYKRFKLKGVTAWYKSFPYVESINSLASQMDHNGLKRKLESSSSAMATEKRSRVWGDGM